MRSSPLQLLDCQEETSSYASSGSSVARAPRLPTLNEEYVPDSDDQAALLAGTLHLMSPDSVMHERRPPAPLTLPASYRNYSTHGRTKLGVAPMLKRSSKSSKAFGFFARMATSVAPNAPDQSQPVPGQSRHAEPIGPALTTLLLPAGSIAACMNDEHAQRDVHLGLPYGRGVAVAHVDQCYHDGVRTFCQRQYIVRLDVAIERPGGEHVDEVRVDAADIDTTQDFLAQDATSPLGRRCEPSFSLRPRAQSW